MLTFTMMTIQPNADGGIHVAVCKTDAKTADDAVKATSNFFDMTVGQPCDAVADDTGRIVWCRPLS